MTPTESAVGVMRERSDPEDDRPVPSSADGKDAVRPRLRRPVRKLIPPLERGSPITVGAAEDVVLSPRQRECLYWAAKGKSSHDIGSILNLSKRTVDEYIAGACKRLGVRTRQQAISVAVKYGLIPLSIP